MSDNRICNDHAANFDTLQRAFADGQVVLLDCIEKSTNEHVAVICAISTEGEQVTVTPFAKFFNGNPFELLIPPTEYDNKPSL
jgi:hypothetical protein